MDIRLDPKPLVPLYPIQPDRQPVYPRALGPVFIGKPFRILPAAPQRTEPDSGPGRIPQGRLEGPASYLATAAGVPDSGAAALGGRLDVKA